MFYSMRTRDEMVVCYARLLMLLIASLCQKSSASAFENDRGATR